MEFPLLTLLCRAGEARFAVPASAVVRVLGAAAFTPVAGLPGAAVGVVNVAGENLPLVAARGLLAQPTAALTLEQQFVLFDAPLGWVLWVDGVDEVLNVHAEQCDALSVAPGSAARFALRLPHETVPLMDVDAIAPPALVRSL
jgi:chemotaxis signal transduction protein